MSSTDQSLRRNGAIVVVVIPDDNLVSTRLLRSDTNVRKLASFTIDQLWILHEEICGVLSRKLEFEKDQLDRRLAQLNGHVLRQRRPYPKVIQKYRNPDRPFDTWSGRGKRPHWVGEQLSKGKKVEDFLVSQPH